MQIINSVDLLPIAPPDHLWGRATIRQQVQWLLAPQQPILLYGMHGIGKHAVAASLAQSMLQKGRSVIWLDGSLDRFFSLGQQLRLAYQHPDWDQAQLGQHLAKDQPLIVLDNLPNLDIAADFIWHVVQQKTSVLVLHTAATDTPWEPIAIRRLDIESARQLFQHFTAANVPQALLDFLDGHPFSLQLAARSGIAPDAFLKALPLEEPHPQKRIHAVMRVAFSALDHSSQGLLMAMGASFAHGMSETLLEYLLGVPGQKLCKPLIERGFLDKQAGMYRFSPLVSEFAHQRLAGSQRIREAKTRLVDALMAYLQDHAGQVTAIQTELSNILLGAAYCAESARWDALQVIVERLAADTRWGLDLRDWQEQLKAYQTQPAIRTEDLRYAPPEQQPADDTQPRKPISPETALTTTQTTALTTPLQNAQAALQEATAKNDRPRMAQLAIKVGEYHLEQMALAPAFAYFQQAVDIHQDLGDLSALLGSLETQARYTFEYQGAEHAQDAIRRGMNIALQTGDDAARCRFLDLLGETRTAMGDLNNAGEAYKRGIRLLRLMNDPERTGIMLGKLAAIYMDTEHYREAVVALSQAIDLFGEARRIDLQGRALGNLGTALGYLGRWREAGQRHAEALKIARQLHDTEEERFQLQNLAFVSETEGYLNWAVNYYQQALYLALLAEDQTTIAALAVELGRLLMEETETLGQAVVLLEHAAEISPKPATLHLLKDANLRYRKAQQARRLMNPAQHDLLLFTEPAYRRSQG